VLGGGRNVACDWSVGGAYYGDTDCLYCDYFVRYVFDIGYI